MVQDPCVGPVSSARSTRREAEGPDRIDRAILARLAEHGRESIARLAAAVSISPSAAQRRLRRLEDDGVVRGYRAVLDRAAIGEGLVVHLTVVLADHAAEPVRAFERAVVAVDGVVTCHHVTGDVDYLLRVHVADVAALDVLLRHSLLAVPNIARITTMVTTSALRDPW